MTGVYIINGKPSLSSTLIAASIKRSGKYNFRVREHDDIECNIEFFENGEPIGISRFSLEDAIKAKLTSGKNAHTWSSYRRNMLYARAISNGARWFCPDVFGGPVYTPDELDVVVNAEGEPIEIPSTPVVVSVDPISIEAAVEATAAPTASPTPPPSTDSTPEIKWKIEKHSQVTICNLTQELQKLGVLEATWRKRMRDETGVESRRELTGPQAAKVMRAFANWIADLRSMQQETTGETRDVLQKQIDKIIRELNRSHAIDYMDVRGEMKRLTGKERRVLLDLDESLKVRDAFGAWLDRLAANDEREAIADEDVPF
jgi:hypothetical protein